VNFILRTLSLSYLRHHGLRTFLTLVGVTAGVAMFASMQTAQFALVASLKSTIDQVAGYAHLQVTAIGGVAEQMQEVIREVPGVRAQAPVIEQVVPLEPAGLGSVLVLGVDLLGDQKMRGYAFAGEDADVDDPLLFLAQPDSIALASSAAGRMGVRLGSPLTLAIGQTRRRAVVRALLQPAGFAKAYAGNVAVMDVYAAQDMLGRGRRFDRIDVRLEDGIAIEDGIARIQRAVGPGYTVETPEHRGTQLSQLVHSLVVGVNITSVFALGIGVFLVFDVFAVAVDRRRRDIGILRAVGATPRQVQALFLVEAALLGALGGALGFVVGSASASLLTPELGTVMGRLYGLQTAAEPRAGSALAGWSIGLGIVASLAGAWVPARAAAALHPVRALATGVHEARASIPSLVPSRLEIGLLLTAVVVGVVSPARHALNTAVVLVAGSAGAILILGRITQRVMLAAARLLPRLAPVSGQLAADSLLGHPRRAGQTTLAVALSFGLVLTTGGYYESMRTMLMKWMDVSITADVFVRASAKFNLITYRFDPQLRERVRSVPGVVSVGTLRHDSIYFRGEPAKLAALDNDAILLHLTQEYIAGDEAGARRGLMSGSACIVSDNFARRFNLGLGDIVDLPTPGGPMRLPVAAVVTAYMSDRGSIFVNASTFAEKWKDDRVDIFEVKLAPGASLEGARSELQARFADIPALVSTRQELIDELTHGIDGFTSVTRSAALMALAIAAVGVLTSLLISVAERFREIAILKALGARSAQIRRSVVMEALCMMTVGFLLALPTEALMARTLGAWTTEVYTGIRLPFAFPRDLCAQILGLLPVLTLLAAWLPASRAARVNVVEGISYE
jgi:putative ABC transport system permease protein